MRWDVVYFNPRPHEEGDKICAFIDAIPVNFNPRPREEGDISLHAAPFFFSYFNPRPREEGDSSKANKLTQQIISIHALVKRATKVSDVDSVELDISIHALVKRATILSSGRRRHYPYFNPRPREEGD